MPCLRAADDTSVMFISIEGVQILALGWLRNDSVATGTKSSHRGSLPHLRASPVLTHAPPPPGFWRDTFRNGGDDLGGEGCLPRIWCNPRNTPCCLAGGRSIWEEHAGRAGKEASGHKLVLEER